MTPLKPSKQHTFDFEKQSVDMNHLKEDVRCASNDPVKENQSQRSDSSEYMKSVMRNFDKNNDISKMDYLMDELDRKGATIQERRNLDGRIIKNMHGMKNLNKDTDALKLSSRENGRNQNILEMNQVSSDSSNMNGRMNKKKGVLHVNDTFIREENKQVTNTIDNVILKINNLERELYEYN